MSAAEGIGIGIGIGCAHVIALLIKRKITAID